MSTQSTFIDDYVGEYLRHAYAAPDLSRDEERLLVERMTAGGRAADRARDQLVMHHLKMVIPIARQFLGSGLPLQDLIQEGNVGLVLATSKFKPEREVRFATCAWWWVRNSITQAARAAGSIHIPASQRKVLSAFKKALKQCQQNGKLPSEERLAEMLKISAADVREMSEWLLFEVSLHTPVGDGESELGDFIEDTKALSPDDVLQDAERKRMLGEALSTLSERERVVVERRFGLQDADEQTLEELSVRFGVSRERIRQIERKALEKMGQVRNLKAAL